MHDIISRANNRDRAREQCPAQRSRAFIILHSGASVRLPFDRGNRREGENKKKKEREWEKWK